MTPHIARDAGVTRRVDVLRPHLGAHGKRRCGINIHAGRPALQEGLINRAALQQADTVRIDLAGCLRRGKFLFCDHAFLQKQALRGVEPLVIVAGPQIEVRVHGLAGESGLIDAPLAQKPGCQRHREGAAFPLGVEQLFLVFRIGIDGAEAVHSAHVVWAVHAEAPSGLRAFSTPIIEFRLTSSSSCSAVQPSVPAGCSGITM